MPIGVKVACSDCGTVTDQVLESGDKEIICPDCRRNMPNIPAEDFKQIEKTLSGQKVLGIIALALVAASIALLWFWADPNTSWASGKAKSNDQQTMFFAAAGGCMLIAAILGALASRKRYVVEI